MEGEAPESFPSSSQTPSSQHSYYLLRAPPLSPGGAQWVEAGNPNTFNGVECELLNTALGWREAAEFQQ